MKTYVQNIFLFFIPIFSLIVWNGNATSIEIKLPVAQLAVSVISFLIIVKLINSKKITIDYDIPKIMIASFLLVTMYSYFSTYRMSINYVAAMPPIYGVILFFLVYVTFKRSDLNALLEIVTYTSIPASLYGIVQFLKLDPVDWIIVSERLRVVSFFGHKNYFAIYLLLVIPINVYLSIVEKSRIKNVLFKLSVVFAFLALMLSYSRGAFVSFLTFSTISFILYLNKKRIDKLSVKRYVYFIPILVFVILPFIMPLRIKNDITNLYKKKELNTRIAFWKGAMEVISRNPFTGIGPGNFRNEYPKNTKNKIYPGAPNRVVNHVHNDFFEIYTEYGFVALILYLIIIISFFIRFWRVYSKGDCTEEESLLLLAVFSSISSFIAYSTVTVAPRFISSQFYFWLLLAIGEILLEEKGKMKSIKIEAVNLKFSMFLAIFCLIGFSLFVSVKRYTSSHLVQKSQNHIKRKVGNASKAIEYLDHAIKMDSKNIEAIYAKGYASFMIGQIEEAKKYYLDISKIYPAYVNIAFNLASCYYRRGNWVEALSYAKESFKQYPNYTPNGIMLGYCYYYLKDFENSKYFCEMILKREPGNMKALSLQGRLDAIKEGGSL